MMIHSLRYQVIYFDHATFQGLSLMKATPSEEWEMLLQHCLMVLGFIFQGFQVSFQFRKTTEDIWSGCSFGQSQHPADAGHRTQPVAATGQTATCSKAQLFWISCCQCAQLYMSALSCKWIHEPPQQWASWKETCLYCRWYSYWLRAAERYKSPSWAHISKGISKQEKKEFCRQTKPILLNLAAKNIFNPFILSPNPSCN